MLFFKMEGEYFFNIPINWILEREEMFNKSLLDDGYKLHIRLVEEESKFLSFKKENEEIEYESIEKFKEQKLLTKIIKLSVKKI